MTDTTSAAVPSAPSPSAPEWTPIAPAADLAPGAMRPFKHGAHQLVVGRAADGAPFALDNRCPHEGYPLASGDLKETSLTCCWHNWKFDVRSGRCTLGGEDVRAYPVRERDGTLEVDLAEPDPSERWPALLASLAEGMHRHDNGRAIRDGVRLLQAGYAPWRLLAEIAAWDARHAEYGTTHALAVAADCGRFLARHPGVEAMVPIAPVIDLAGESNQRLPARPQPAPDPAGGEEGAGTAIRAAVEAEDGGRAEALLLGAFDAGVGRRIVEGWLYGVLSDHFTDFGHQLIYLVKAQELLAHVDERYAARTYPALLHSAVVATREDTLPYMKAYADRLREVEPELARVYAACRDDAGPAAEDAALHATLRDAVLEGRSARDAFDPVWNALVAGTPPEAVARALVAAAAHRLLRFDVAVEQDPLVAENWLWATHRFTFASAVRNAVTRFRSPDALRFLLQAVMFVHSGRAMDLAPADRVPLEPRSDAADVHAVLAAITAKDAERAVGGALALARAGAVDALREAVEDLCLRDPLVRPIVVAHAIKTPVAAFEEHAALTGGPDAEVPLAAAVRLLASPIEERRVHKAVGTSIRWVVDGQVPRKLTQ